MYRQLRRLALGEMAHFAGESNKETHKCMGDPLHYCIHISELGWAGKPGVSLFGSHRARRTIDRIALRLNVPQQTISNHIHPF